MKVIRNGTGWDIAFDMIFIDKQTAAIIASRIAPLLPTLIRDAVDATMCKQVSPGVAPPKIILNTAVPVSEPWAHRRGATKADIAARDTAVPDDSAAASIVSRVRAMDSPASLLAE